MPREGKSVCLLSGGLDSCVAAAIAHEETEVCCFLSVGYGQRHSRELESSRKLALYWSSPTYKPHYLIDIPDLGSVLKVLHGSALVDSNEALPSGRKMSEMTGSVPRSYVPGRNTILLALAQSIAEASNADFIYCGFNAVDFSGYPDCRPIFRDSWNGLARVATKRGYENNPIVLRAPIIDLSKTQVVRRGLDLGVPFELTWSCYAGRSKPCGRCDSCIIRYSAFKENGLADPVGAYETEPECQVS